MGSPLVCHKIYRERQEAGRIFRRIHILFVLITWKFLSRSTNDLNVNATEKSPISWFTTNFQDVHVSYSSVCSPANSNSVISNSPLFRDPKLFPLDFPFIQLLSVISNIFSFPWEFQIAVVQLHVIYRAWGLYEGNTGPCLEHGVDNTQERNFFSWYGLEQVNDWMIEKRFVETIPCPILRKYWTDWKTFWLAELSY